MKNVKKIADNILCESLKNKVSQMKAPLPDKLELKLDEDGQVEISSTEFEKLGEIMDRLADDISLSDIMSEDGIQTDVSMDIFINFSAHPEIKTSHDVEVLVKDDIENEFETKRILDPDERSNAYSTVDIKVHDFKFDPTKKIGTFKVEWTEGGESWGGNKSKENKPLPSWFQ